MPLFLSSDAIYHELIHFLTNTFVLKAYDMYLHAGNTVMGTHYVCMFTFNCTFRLDCNLTTLLKS